MLPQTAPIPSFLRPLNRGLRGRARANLGLLQGGRGQRVSGAPQAPAASPSACELAHRILSGRVQDRAKPPSRVVKIEILPPDPRRGQTPTSPKTCGPEEPTSDGWVRSCRSRCLNSITNPSCHPELVRHETGAVVLHHETVEERRTAPSVDLEPDRAWQAGR